MTADTSAGQPNRLQNETSPYLLQHAYNPVDWYPWGTEALARARAEDRPILLSVGYSACHWCHVMAHESFEDPDIAALMNRLFVNIKVDREERPDIDAIYMEAVQAMTGSGGWPMTVFLTPEGKPFYGGTYFPPTARQGMPGFGQVLQAVADAWTERRHELETAGERIAEALGRSAAIGSSGTELTQAVLERATDHLLRSLDRVEGGFGRAPKFPQPMNLDFLLQVYRRTGKVEILEAITLTLTKMAYGGMYDQLGGGFHRYSTDGRWLIPHFEKMLYDNAQLARIYLHAWQVTGDPDFRRVTEETLDYVLREMTSPEGGFYSAQDADSEGEEGKFFVWTPDEVAELLGKEDARLFSAYYDVTPRGNFHEGGPGRSVLHVARDLKTVATAVGVTPDALEQAVKRGREVLFSARSHRVKPGRDEKILAEWNGLMLHAFAEAGAVLQRSDYLSAAARSGRFILERMATAGADGRLRLYRSYREGKTRLPAYLEDYASVALGMLALYEATLEIHWLNAATGLAELILELFYDRKDAAFFQTSPEHEQLVARRKDFVDNAIPAGNSLAADLYLRLGKLLSRAGYERYATGIMDKMAAAMSEQAAAFGRVLCALDFYLNPGYEVAIVGEPDAVETRALLAEVQSRYLPTSILALRRPGDEDAPALIPFLADRTPVHGRAAAYVCRDYVCNLPVTDAAPLAAQLT
jgi:uncharacterized protein